MVVVVVVAVAVAVVVDERNAIQRSAASEAHRFPTVY